MSTLSFSFDLDSLTTSSQFGLDWLHDSCFSNSCSSRECSVTLDGQEGSDSRKSQKASPRTTSSNFTSHSTPESRLNFEGLEISSSSKSQVTTASAISNREASHAISESFSSFPGR